MSVGSFKFHGRIYLHEPLLEFLIVHILKCLATTIKDLPQR